MASVSTEKATGLRRVTFSTSDGRRVALHVGKASMASARSIGTHVDHLVTCRRSGADCRRSTREWVERIRLDWPKLAKRLARLGLISNEVRSDPVFADFVDSLIAGRSDVKPNTIKAWRQTAEKIRLFFGNRTIRRSVRCSRSRSGSVRCKCYGRFGTGPSRPVRRTSGP